MSFPIDEWQPEVQTLAKKLRANPSWMLYPTDDFFEDKEKYENSHIGGYWSAAYGFMEKPMTVKKAVERYIGGRFNVAPKYMLSELDKFYPSVSKDYHEGLWPETEIANDIFRGVYTTDPREAAMHIRDKYTGPKD